MYRNNNNYRCSIGYEIYSDFNRFLFIPSDIYSLTDCSSRSIFGFSGSLSFHLFHIRILSLPALFINFRKFGVAFFLFLD